MEDSDGRHPVVRADIAQAPNSETKQEHSGSIERTLTAMGKSPTGRLREANAMSEGEDDGTTRRSRTAHRRPLCCQVDGCGVELAQARKYFQRYRVCERHLKSPSLQMDGRSVRFCDQCSKFHDISMFEGTRRTCNEKLQRTRQARSDKRRKQTEEAERAKAGCGRPRSQDAASSKRQHAAGDEDDSTGFGNEQCILAGECQAPLKRGRPLAVPLSGASPGAAPSDPREAQGVWALPRVEAFAAAAAAAGNPHLNLVGADQGLRKGQGISLASCSGHEYFDGGGAAGGGGSSRSSGDGCHPHAQLLRMDSVTSLPGCADGAQEPFLQITGTEPTGLPALPLVGEGSQGLRDRRASAPGPVMSAALQAAALPKERHGADDGGVFLGAAGRDVRGDVWGLGSASGWKAVPRYRNLEPVQSKLLVPLDVSGSSAGGPVTRRLGPKEAAMPYIDALAAPGRVAGAGMSSGRHFGARGGGSAGAELPAPGLVRLLEDLRAAGGLEGEESVGDAAAAVEADELLHEAAVAALSAVLASLAARRGTSRAQHATAAASSRARTADCSAFEDVMASAERILSGLISDRAADGSAFQAGGGSALGPGDRARVHARSLSHVPLERTMPVLDLAAHVPPSLVERPPPPLLLAPPPTRRDVRGTDTIGGGGDEAASQELQRLNQLSVTQLLHALGEYDDARPSARFLDRARAPPPPSQWQQQQQQWQRLAYALEDHDRRQMQQTPVLQGTAGGSAAAPVSKAATALHGLPAKGGSAALVKAEPQRLPLEMGSSAAAARSTLQHCGEFAARPPPPPSRPQVNALPSQFRYLHQLQEHIQRLGVKVVLQ